MASVSNTSNAVQKISSMFTSNLFTFTIIFLFTRNWLEGKSRLFRISLIFTSLCTIPLAMCIQAVVVAAGLFDWLVEKAASIVQGAKGAELKFVIVLKSKHVLLMLMLYFVFTMLVGAK